jgi:hypothetical protein
MQGVAWSCAQYSEYWTAHQNNVRENHSYSGNGLNLTTAAMALKSNCPGRISNGMGATVWWRQSVGGSTPKRRSSHLAPPPHCHHHSLTPPWRSEARLSSKRDIRLASDRKSVTRAVRWKSAPEKGAEWCLRRLPSQTNYRKSGQMA